MPPGTKAPKVESSVCNAKDLLFDHVRLPITIKTVDDFDPVLHFDDGESPPEVKNVQEEGGVPTPQPEVRRSSRLKSNPTNYSRMCFTPVTAAFTLFTLMAMYFTNLSIPRATKAPVFSTYEGAEVDKLLESKIDINFIMEQDELLEAKRAQDCKDINLNDMNDVQMRMFRYIKLCETFTDDENDEEAPGWTPILIDKFMVRRKNPEDVHVKIRVSWLNGERNWVRLEDFQAEHPDMVVNFAIENELCGNQYFSWCARYAKIRNEEKQPSIFSDSGEARAILATRYDPQGKYKFGVEVPFNTRHALKLDVLNGNDLWKNAIAKELQEINEMKVFRKTTTEDDLSKYKKIPYHIVFDVKFDGRRKARLVCSGNMTDVPSEDVYSGVVSLDTVRLGFQIANMQNLQVCAADIGTAFLYGKTRKKGLYCCWNGVWGSIWNTTNH